MSSTLTIVSLACAIANSGPVDTTSIQAQLTDEGKAQVNTIIESGACLPENMEVLLDKSRLKVKSGELEVNGALFRAAPSDVCL